MSMYVEICFLLYIYFSKHQSLVAKEGVFENLILSV